VTTVVLDLDGVVYRGDTQVAGAGAALESLTAKYRVLLATNNSRRSREDVADKVWRLTGVAIGPEWVVTSAVAAARIVEVVPTAVVGGPGIVEALEGVGVPIVGDEEAAQLVTGLDTGFGFARMRSAADLLRRGVPWVATNTDATFPVEGGLMPGAGSIVAALATASGRTPVVAGKPHPPMVAALAGLAADGRVVVVGDRPETDLALAKAGGWESVLVLSGVTSGLASVPESLAPDAVIDSLADLPGWLEGSSGTHGVA
jgi:HAD superfamily hydrolase (TIGR01450 family)